MEQPPAAAKPLVSVVIPSYNRLESLKDALSGLVAQTLPASSFEVVVVDNASTDGTLAAMQALAETLPFALRVVRIPGENRGPAPARNFGVSQARGAIIAFTDSDCRPDREWLDKGLQAFSDPALAFATGVVNFKPEQKHLLGFFARLTVTSSYEHPTYPTANAFYRKQCFEQFSGFSEQLSFPSIFGIAVEAADTDLAWRIKEAGYRNAFVADAIVHHEVQIASPGAWLLEPLRLFLIPALVKLHPGMRQALLAHGLFFYRGSIPYYLIFLSLVVVMIVSPLWLLAIPVAIVALAVWKTGSLEPRAVVMRSGQIMLNAARIYVMSFALIYGSLRFGALVL